MNQDIGPDTSLPPSAAAICDRGRLALELAQSALTLPRLVWLVEQRGFRIERMQMDPHASGFRVEMEVMARAPHYRFEVLGRQVDRLVGVRRLQEAAA